MWSEAIYHGAARLASAAASFLLFALIARLSRPEDAKAIYSFCFALGFLIVSLRAFGPLTARLDGAWAKTRKLRAVLKVSGQLLILQGAAVLVAGLLFRSHPLSPRLVLAACVMVALSSFDSDLLRAALNKRSSFSAAFASGGVLAVAVFLLAPSKTIEAGCAALLVQWVPVASINVYVYYRLLRRSSRTWELLTLARMPSVLSSLLVAVFDGVVLNAPFLLGSRVGARAGLDLSVATRIFVSSLPLFPLVMHWSNNGSLAALAVRLDVRERRLFSGMVAASGGCASVVLAALYVWVSRKDLTWLQYGLSLVLLIAYSFYAGQMRYGSHGAAGSRRTVLLSGVLLVFGVLCLLGMRFANLTAGAFVALEASALVMGAVMVNAQAAASAPKDRLLRLAPSRDRHSRGTGT